MLEYYEALFCIVIDELELNSNYLGFLFSRYSEPCIVVQANIIQFKWVIMSSDPGYP
jgi:hypothetical protein